jgi:hypothetical protein
MPAAAAQIKMATAIDAADRFLAVTTDLENASPDPLTARVRCRCFDRFD